MEVLRWLILLIRCQQLLCIEFNKELKSCQTNAELQLCLWHIVCLLSLFTPVAPGVLPAVNGYYS